MSNKRLSVLKRLGTSNPTNARRSLPTTVTDARELLTRRNQSTFDARQLLNRPTSNGAAVILRKSLPTDEKLVVITGIKDTKMKDGRLVEKPMIGADAKEKTKKIIAMGSSTLVTIRNPNKVTTVPSTGKISLTKTISNPSVPSDVNSVRLRTNESQAAKSDQNVIVRIVNDKYEKGSKPSTITRSASPLIEQDSPPPIIKRLHDASIQTSTSPSTSRSPIRINAQQRLKNTSVNRPTSSVKRSIEETEDDDAMEEAHEPPVKRTNTTIRRTTREQEIQSSSSAPVKRTATTSSIASRISSATENTSSSKSKQTNTGPGTILVTNLQPSVTEDDVIELFSEIGRINEITTLSQGCVQIVYAKREHAEQAVTKYHNRLLDGQFMYVSLQQPPPAPPSTTKASSSSSSTSAPSNKEANSSSSNNQPLKLNANSSSSNKIVIDPVFFRQALFNPSNNTSNPVQFQVKL